MRRYSVITYGCQMNKNISERIANFFEKNGLIKANEDRADIVVLNACSVRQSAVDRIEGKAKNIKKKKDAPMVILTGCLLEKDKKKFAPYFDHILDIEKLSQWDLPFLKKESKDYLQISPKRESHTAYIPIATGCDNFCSYCVVPYVKGREVSRSADEVIREAEEAVKKGCKEIWLLGQNVNSYGKEITFPELLLETENIKGDFWIRFTSSHPKDFSDEIISVMKKGKKITPYLNLPLQSGDDEILKRMNRPYTSSHYRKIVHKVRGAIPGIFLSTDIIVGFPGEKEDHFKNTAEIFREVKFDTAYISRYSPRKNTTAYKMPDSVTEEEKKRRERILTEIIKEHKAERHKNYKGKNEKVLVNKKGKDGLLIGKTKDYRDVAFQGPKELVGQFVDIKITDYSPWGLKGKLIRK